MREANIDANTAADLLSGLQDLRERLSEAEAVGSMADELPFVGQSLGQLLDLDEVLQVGLIERLTEFFADENAEHTAAGVIQRLREMDFSLGSLAVQVDVPSVAGGIYLREAGEELRFDLTIQVTNTQANTPVTLGELASEQGLVLPETVPVDFVASATFSLSFGIALSEGGAFFVRVNELIARADLHESNLDFPLNVGFLGAAVEGGRIDLDAEVALRLFDGFGQTIYQEQLAEAGVPELMFATDVLRNDLEVEWPVQATLGSFSTLGTNPVLRIADGEALESEAEFALQDFAELLPFRNVTAAEVVTMLENVREWFAKVESRLPTNLQVPFTSELTTKNLFDMDERLRPGRAAGSDCGGRLADVCHGAGAGGCAGPRHRLCDVRCGQP